MQFRTRAAFCAAAALAAGCALLVRAQQKVETRPPLIFEVASIKPTPPDEPRSGLVHQPPGGHSYEAIGAPLRQIMMIAYTVTDRQISGGPAWVNTDRWTIEAKAERRGTSDELHDALAHLLEDRFNLKVRHEKRDMPCYILTVDAKGARIPAHDAADLDHNPYAISFDNGELHLTFRNQTISYLAFTLSHFLDYNVIDQTGLAARYDFDYHYVPELPRRPDGSPGLINGQPVSQDGPDIFAALREQLGLRLERGRGPVDFLVIEHVEKPSAN